MKEDHFVRIPVTLKDPNDKNTALEVKQIIERREGKALSWAHIIRLAIYALAEKEGIKNAQL